MKVPMSFPSPYGIIGSVKTLPTALCVALAIIACADESSFDRYQSIIDRKPFGPEPVNFDPESEPGTASSAASSADGGEMTPEQRTAEEQQLASSVRVSMLNVTPSGVVKVGFTDNSAKPAENYYLAVGGSQNGWTVKNADPATESVTLERGGVEVTVKLGETTGGKGDKGGRGGIRNMPLRSLSGQSGARRDGMSADGGGPPGGPPMGGLARLRQRRMEMEEQKREEDARKREADAVAKAEREEREAREAEEKQREAEERAQQREALLQIQEQLKRQREEREAARKQQGEDEQGETDNP